MKLRLLFVIAVVSGCASDPDTRPATFQVVTQEVLMPSCGAVQCHSRTSEIGRHGKHYAFDTLEDARFSLGAMGVPASVTLGFPRLNELYNSLIGANNINQMPIDAPMNQLDIDLVGAWLDAGAPGL